MSDVVKGADYGNEKMVSDPITTDPITTRDALRRGPSKMYLSYRDLLLVVAYILMLLILMALYSSPGGGLDIAKSSIYLALAALAVTLHLARQRTDNWLRPDVIFLVGFLIVHYQWLVMALVTDILPERTNYLFPMQAHVTYGAWLSTIALISWLAGFAFANPDRCIKLDRVVNGPRKVLLIAVTVFLAFVTTVDAGYFTAELYRTVQVDLFQTVGGIAAYLLSITEILTLILLSLFFYSRIVNRIGIARGNPPMGRAMSFWGSQKYVVIFYFLAYLSAFFLAGERGQLIQLLIALGVVYAINFRSIRLSELVVIGSLAALVFTGIGVARSLDEALTLEHLIGATGLWALTVNLANSSITLYQGIDLVHSGNGYFYGELWMSQILGIVPFLQSIFLALTSWDSENINSATKITAYILGPNPHTGFGTSFVIDIYLNFAVPGILFFSFLYGYVCKVASQWIHGTSGFSRFFVAVAFVSLMFYVSRSSLLIQLRPVVWGLVIILLLVSTRRQK
jgi:hypothetical protein